MASAAPRKKRKLSIASQVFIGLGLGIVVGVFFGEEAAFLKIGGDAFIALLQITVIPYVVVALITSIGRLTLEDVKELGLRAGGILLVLWAIGLVVVLATPLALPDWPSASFFSASQIEEREPVDFLQLYIPSNFISALSNAIVPAIVVFSILFGLALIRVPGKERLLELLATAGDALMGITGFVGKLAPYGVFAITASAAGTIDPGDLGRLQVFIVVYVAMALILSFWLIPGLISALTPLSHRAVLRAFRGPLITAFATGNVLIVLPILAADAKRLLEEVDDTPEQPGEPTSSPVDILIPAAFPFPNLGFVLTLAFVPFGGWYVGSLVSWGDYPTLAIAGLASLFGGTVLALPFLFDLLRMPADLFQVFVTVDVIGSRFGTLLAALHIIAIALIGTYAMQGRIRLRPVPLVRFAAVSVVLVATTLLGIRAFYTYVYVEDYTKGQLLASLDLLGEPQPHTVYRTPPADTLSEAGPPASFELFKQRGTLRACYVSDNYPSSFFNQAGDLVGFDIEMVHRFARHLDVPVELLPVASFREAEERLNSSYCDVYMSLTAISPARTEQFSMTSPLRNEPVGLIVRDHRRDAFRTWAEIRDIPGLRVAIFDDRSSKIFLKQVVPAATPILLRSKRDVAQLLATDAPGVDAVGMFAEQAAAWTIRHPQFSFVVPSPAIFIPSGYAVARGDLDMLLYLDTWLLNAKLDGTVDELYRFWMLGEVAETQPPRWSVIRNVLGWID